MIFPIRAARRPFLLAAVPLLAVVAVAPFWTSLVSTVEAAVSTLSAPSITTGVGHAVDVPITLDSAPNGISGFEITLTLSNPSVATIDNVLVTPEFGLRYVEQVSTSEVKISGADIDQVLQGSLSGVPFATLKMTATKQGSSDILISLTRLDDDDGLPMDVQVADGSLNVKKKLNGGGGGGDRGGKGGQGGNHNKGNGRGSHGPKKPSNKKNGGGKRSGNKKGSARKK